MRSPRLEAGAVERVTVVCQSMGCDGEDLRWANEAVKNIAHTVTDRVGGYPNYSLAFDRSVGTVLMR